MIHNLTYLDVRGQVVAICACGWESEPHSNPFDAIAEDCAVLQAELDGARRKFLRQSASQPEGRARAHYSRD